MKSAMKKLAVASSVLVILVVTLLPYGIHSQTIDSNDPVEAIATNTPEIVSRGGSLSVRENEPVSLECQVRQLGDYVPIWKYKAKGLPSRILYVNKMGIQSLPGVMLDNKTNSIVINNFKADMAGQYICELSTSDKDSIVYTVSVATAPVLTGSPQSGSISVLKDQPVELHCHALASPYPVTYKWLHHDTPINRNTSSFYIARAQPSDKGNITCVAWNEIGENRKTFNVLVNYKPTIRLSDVIVHGPIGDDIEIICRVDASPKAAITWHFSNNSQLTNPSKHRINDLENQSVLRIHRLNLKDYDKYYCHAKNMIGEDIQYFDVTGRPSKPKFTSAQVGNEGDSYTLRWTVYSHIPIIGHQLKIRDIVHGNAASIPSNWRTINISPETASVEHHVHTQWYELKNLDQFKGYEVVLEVENSQGKTSSETFSFSTSYVNQAAPVAACVFLLIASMMAAIF